MKNDCLKDTISTSRATAVTASCEAAQAVIARAAGAYGYRPQENAEG